MSGGEVKNLDPSGVNLRSLLGIYFLAKEAAMGSGFFKLFADDEEALFIC